MEIEIIKDNENRLNEICNHLNIRKENFIKTLIENELENTIYLIDDYVYDKRRKILIKNRAIVFNNQESQLLAFLGDNINKYVSNDDVIDELSRSKRMSIYGLRNLVNGIRSKTTKDLIINKSNIGYRLNCLFN